jgi:nickel transport protein
MREGARWLVLVLCLLSGAAGRALAHNIKVFATAEGSRISGEVYVDASTPIEQATVRVYAAGRLVHQTTSGEDGRFAFQAPCHADMRIVAGTTDGHRAEWTVRSSELPASLRPCSAQTAPAEPAPAEPPSDSPVQATGDAPRIRRLVEDSVARQVAPLRRQLRSYEQKVRVRDVLGGIGYILGVFGTVALLAARRRNREG